MSDDILTLGMQADEARRRLRGTEVTYQRVHVVPVEGVAPAAIPDAATEVRIIGQPSTRDEAIALVRRVRDAAGRRTVSAFSYVDVQAYLDDLRAAGADALAEVPIDQIDDLPAALDRIRQAGLRVERLTMTHPAGDRAAALLARVQAAIANHEVRRFAPLPRVAPLDKPTTGYEDVRLVAQARLALPISIEVDWVQYGPKLAQVALLFGADHFDAVPATSDDSLGARRATVQDVERNIRAAGFEPRECHE